jgi:hypothetical protein
MWANMSRTMAAVALLGLLAAACGGSDSGDSSAAASTSETSAATGRFRADDPVVGRAGELAEQLVDLLEDDDTAVGAVLLAGDAGYTGPQIAAGVVNDGLAADGSIEGFEPALPRVGLIVGLRRTTPTTLPPIPIEDLRRRAHEEGGREDIWPVGASATGSILALHLAGYSQEQIVDALILGAAYLDETFNGEVAEGEEACSGLVIGGRHEIPKYCDPDSGELFGEPKPSTTVSDDAPAATQPAQVDESGSIENGTYTGSTDESSDFGQFFNDLEGIATVNTAQVVVEGGTVVSFMAELSGLGASNLNIATGERLCENAVKISAVSSDPSKVTVSGNTAQVPVTFTFAQEVGSGSECFPESNVFFGDTFEDVATITFTDDTAVAVLTAGFGATMTR